MEDDLNYIKMEDNLNYIKMEDDLNFFQNGRRPHLFQNVRQPQYCQNWKLKTTAKPKLILGLAKLSKIFINLYSTEGNLQMLEEGLSDFQYLQYFSGWVET